MTISYSSTFKRSFKRKIKKRKDIQDKFFEYLEIFSQNPFNPKLKTHKLTGDLKDFWSFSLEFDLRVVFAFEENFSKAVLMDIGTHDEVY